MAKARSLVGLDVHATKIVAAVLDAETGELQFFRLGGDVGEAAGLCAGLPRPVRAAYEAGPTGYGLARELARRGVECVVAAPSKIPRASGDRVKTDRRDAELLVRLLLAGKLHAVRVPGPEEEALRDLVRAREAVRVDLMRCRHRLSQAAAAPRHPLRRRAARGRSATATGWPAIELGWPAAQATLLDAQRRDRRARAPPRRARARDRRAAARLAVGSPGRPAALPARDRHADRGRAVRRDRRLRALRARRAADELRRPGALREHDRPAAPARRDHQDRLRPRPPTARRGRLALPHATRGSARRSADRQDGQPAEAVAIAWSAQQRLHRTWTRLEARAKRRTIIAVAAARELAGFCWAITRIE